MTLLDFGSFSPLLLASELLASELIRIRVRTSLSLRGGGGRDFFRLLPILPPGPRYTGPDGGFNHHHHHHHHHQHFEHCENHKVHTLVVHLWGRRNPKQNLDDNLEFSKFSQGGKGEVENSGEGKTYNKNPPQNWFWTPPPQPMIRFPPCLCLPCRFP